MVISMPCFSRGTKIQTTTARWKVVEEVYIDPPKGFGGADGIHKVLRLLKSLYGLKQAPKTFFDKLKAGLEVSSLDLYMLKFNLTRHWKPYVSDITCY
jgi:hypothetical protein